MSAQKVYPEFNRRGFAKIILVLVIVIAAGLTGFFLLNKQTTSLPIPADHQQNQPQQSNNNQPQGGYGFKQPFYQKDGILLQHYWPGEGSFSAEETEILVLNTGNSSLQITSFNLTYTVSGESYPHKSGTWEKFPSKQSWERQEYLNISPQYYKNEALILESGQKGKLHWHIQFGSQPLDGKQTAIIKLTLLQSGKSTPVEQTLTRDSGIVMSKEDH